MAGGVLGRAVVPGFRFAAAVVGPAHYSNRRGCPLPLLYGGVAVAAAVFYLGWLVVRWAVKTT